MAIDRRLLANVDWACCWPRLLLACIGVATIISATHSTRLSDLYVKQL